MGKKKPSKAKKRVRALKKAEPTSVLADDTDWAQFEPEELKEAPHSFIIYRGKVGRYMKELMRDLRKVMEPFTATNLKMKKGNVLKDYVSIASYFHVSHLCILTRTVVSPYLKICKIPRGPTLTFRILNYSLARDVLSRLRKQVTFEAQFLHQPLLIMNNFSAESQTLDLVSKTFQNMLPSINVNKVRLSEIRRVLLLNYFEEDDTIELRHYTITFKTTGVSKAMKRVLISKNGKIPNLGRCTDIADFIHREGDISESEAEDTTETAAVSQKMGVKISKGLEEVGIKLVELGPRIKMQLIKVEEGLCDGEILYHKIVDKTPEEKLFIRQQRNLKKKMKLARKREQDMNVQKKKKEKEDHKQKCLQGMKGIMNQSGDINPGPEEDDDADWYRKEVGEDPDEGTFDQTRKFSTESRQDRKRKFTERGNDGERPFKIGRVSKFTKVKEKEKLMKKLKQKGLAVGSKRRDRGEFNSERGSRSGFPREHGNRGGSRGGSRGGFKPDRGSRSSFGRRPEDGPGRDGFQSDRGSRSSFGRGSRGGPSRGGFRSDRGSRSSFGRGSGGGPGGFKSERGARPGFRGGGGGRGQGGRRGGPSKMFNRGGGAGGSRPRNTNVGSRRGGGGNSYRSGKA